MTISGYLLQKYHMIWNIAYNLNFFAFQQVFNRKMFVRKNHSKGN